MSFGEFTLLASSGGWMALSFCTLAYYTDVQMISIQKEKCVCENLRYRGAWFSPLQRKTPIYFYRSRFHCELSWWHDQYPDSIQPPSTGLWHMLSVIVTTVPCIWALKC